MKIRSFFQQILVIVCLQVLSGRSIYCSRITKQAADNSDNFGYLSDIISPGFNNIQTLDDPTGTRTNIYYAIQSSYTQGITIQSNTDNNTFAVNLSNNETLFGIETTRTAGWFGFGRSLNGGMIGSEALVAQFPNNASFPQLDYWFLAEKNYKKFVNISDQIPIGNQYFLTLTNPTRRLLLFTRYNMGGKNPIQLAIQQPYVFSASQYDTLAEGIHNESRSLIMDIQQQGSSESLDQGNTYNKQRILGHGALNFITYICLFPLGILISRNRKLLSGTVLVNNKPTTQWFIAHLTIQVIAISLTLSAIIMALTAFNVGSNGLPGSHKALGLLLLVLVVLQGLLAIFSPKKYRRQHKKYLLRRIWEQMHHWNGRLIILIGMINVVQGIVLADQYGYIKRWQWFAAYIVIIVLFVLLFIGCDILRLMFYDLVKDKTVYDIFPFLKVFQRKEKLEAKQQRALQEQQIQEQKKLQQEKRRQERQRAYAELKRQQHDQQNQAHNEQYSPQSTGKARKSEQIEELQDYPENKDNNSSGPKVKNKENSETSNNLGSAKSSSSLHNGTIIDAVQFYSQKNLKQDAQNKNNNKVQTG